MTQNDSPGRLQALLHAATERRSVLTALLAGVTGSLGLADLEAKKKKGKNKGKNKKKKNKNGGGSGGSGSYSPDSEERAFLDLINDYRRNNGAGALTLNNNLGAAADYHSRDMAQKN